VSDPRTRRLFVIGLLVAVVVAVVAAQFASSDPDGLEYVAEQEGFAETAEDHTLADSPLADYGENLTNSSWVNTAFAGLLGTLATLGVGYGVFWLARRTRRNSTHPGSA
jgi:ABC-type Fe3+ transport system permease subunit